MRFPFHAGAAPAALALALLAAAPSRAQEEEFRLRDRAPGIPTSMFGIHVEPGQWLVYPFFEYYLNGDEEYKPAELGYGLEADYRGRYTASEELLYVAHAFGERWMFELEAALIQATLEKADDDPSSFPSELGQSGLGDVEGQLRYLWAAETAKRPMVFSYFEAVAPTQDEGSLIGTSAWELKLGSGVTRQFGFGTATLRAAVEHDAGEGKTELGEVAFEWLRRFSPRWRGYLGLEGTQDEWELITDIHWSPAPRLTLKVSNAFGVTSKAVDWAPEVGLLWRLGGR